MKNCLLLISFMLWCGIALGQRSECKGYIGFTVNSAIPTGDFADNSKNNSKAGFASTGANIGLVNFGYNFNSRFGIAALWFFSAHAFNGFKNITWGYGGLMAGPMLTYPIAYNLKLDLKGMLGYARASLSDDNSEIDATGVGFDFGATIRFNFARRWCFLANADYFSSDPKFEDFNQKISALNLGIGIAYRLH
ncbi:outer membrane beta-barrel protein [Ancylomarina longa]|uniref:Outer membrane protein beta-barrel domain-containing protein n=1 Tax=Ancylomarina longa TaxID=2487017 RepID=A0A434AWV8_9BACT|nr:outer membrane beta-barrel protein [Ancylomarina longa]RUT78909.1 hypothetical protein DLK05_05335 [Ancylomarina longa]